MPFQIDGRGDMNAFVLTSPLAGVMLLTRRQPFYPSAAHDKFFSICTAFGGYTEFGIVPGEIVTRPGTSNPTALLVFLEGFRLFAERDKFFDLCFAFPGKEVHDCFRDCLIYHFREDGGVHADIQFFGDKDHRLKFRITLASLQIYDRAGVHTEAFS